MTLKDYFDINEFFNPIVYNADEIKLGGRGKYDYLFINSKINPKTKINMYSEFLEKYFWAPLNGYIRIENIDNFINTRILSSTYNLFDTTDITRRLNISFLVFALSVKNYLELDNQTTEEINQLFNESNRLTYDELYKILDKAIRRRREIFFDVKRKGTLSKYYQEITKNFRKHGIKTKQEILIMIDKQINEFTSFIVGMKKISTLFSKELPKEELLECFDYDKFCLITAKSALDSSNSKNAATIYIDKYLNAVKKYREKNPTYNCTITLASPDLTKKIKYSISDLEREYEQFLINNPEAIPFNIELDDINKLLKNNGYSDEFIENFDLSKLENVNILYNLLEKQKKLEVLKTSWNIFPKGTKLSIDLEVSSFFFGKQLNLNEEEKNRRMLISYHTLEESNYLFKLEGINEFEGYIGYMYPSGKVVFEKYYDNFQTKKVASKSATYIINDFNYFIEVSKMTKTEIIEKLKNGSLKGIVERVYHQEDMNRWTSKVKQALLGSDYTDEIIEYIETIINSGLLKNKGESR